MPHANGPANCRSMQRNIHETLVSKVDSIEKNIHKSSKDQQAIISAVRDRVQQGVDQNERTRNAIQADLRLGTELKGIVSQIFTMSGTTLSAVQRIEERLPSHSEMTLTTFTLEDAISRVTQVDMLFVSSWDAFDAMLEGCFRAFPGHKKVAKKEYVCSMIIPRTRRLNAPFRGRNLFSPDTMSTWA
jgi:hypothetical protein